MRSILFCLAFLWASGLSAQSLKVTVRDADAPLAFANVWLNGTYLASADSTGMLSIPENMLTPGDTISSSFLGFDPAFVVYDDAVRSVHAATLVLEKDRIYEIEEIVVTDRMGGWAAFERFVNPTRAAFNRIIGGNFEAKVRMPDGSVRSVGGTFSTENGFKPQDPLYSRESQIAVNQCNTTWLSRMLMRNLSYLKFIPNGLINRLDYVHNHVDSERANPYRTLTYLGTQDGRRNFTFTYVSPEIRGTNQLFLSVDAESGAPQSFRFTTTAEAGGEAAVHSSSIELVPQRRQTRPSSIEVDFREVDGIQMELKLTELTIE